MEVKNDLIVFVISNFSVEYFSRFSKNEFKRLINVKCKIAAFSHLLNEKANKKKGNCIRYDKFEMQNYLKRDSGISPLEAKRIFSLRSHSLDLAENYSRNYTSKACIKKCLNGQDSQAHLYECLSLQNQSIIHKSNIIAYEEIYGKNVQNQVHIMRVIYSAYKTRCELLSSLINTEDPVGPQA